MSQLQLKSKIHGSESEDQEIEHQNPELMDQIAGMPSVFPPNENPEDPNLQDAANSSPRILQLKAMAIAANKSPAVVAQQKRQAAISPNLGQAESTQEMTAPPLQLRASKANNNPGQKTTAPDSMDQKTGLPFQLKQGAESFGGVSLDDVKVHYNSAKPIQLMAHAYAQGSDIHLGPGQEKHLSHETWHVVQQKQGRVKANTQLKGTGINDDSSLEKEADIMGAKSASFTGEYLPSPLQSGKSNAVIQRVTVQIIPNMDTIHPLLSQSNSKRKEMGRYEGEDKVNDGIKDMPILMNQDSNENDDDDDEQEKRVAKPVSKASDAPIAAPKKEEVQDVAMKDDSIKVNPEKKKKSSDKEEADEDDDIVIKENESDRKDGSPIEKKIPSEFLVKSNKLVNELTVASENFSKDSHFPDYKALTIKDVLIENRPTNLYPSSAGDHTTAFGLYQLYFKKQLLGCTLEEAYIKCISQFKKILQLEANRPNKPEKELAAAKDNRNKGGDKAVSDAKMSEESDTTDNKPKKKPKIGSDEDHTQRREATSAKLEESLTICSILLSQPEAPHRDQKLILYLQHVISHLLELQELTPMAAVFTAKIPGADHGMGKGEAARLSYLSHLDNLITDKNKDDPPFRLEEKTEALHAALDLFDFEAATQALMQKPEERAHFFSGVDDKPMETIIALLEQKHRSAILAAYPNIGPILYEKHQLTKEFEFRFNFMSKAIVYGNQNRVFGKMKATSKKDHLNFKKSVDPNAAKSTSRAKNRASTKGGIEDLKHAGSAKKDLQKYVSEFKDWDEKATALGLPERTFEKDKPIIRNSGRYSMRKHTNRNKYISKETKTDKELFEMDELKQQEYIVNQGRYSSNVTKDTDVVNIDTLGDNMKVIHLEDSDYDYSTAQYFDNPYTRFAKYQSDLARHKKRKEDNSSSKRKREPDKPEIYSQAQLTDFLNPSNPLATEKPSDRAFTKSNRKGKEHEDMAAYKDVVKSNKYGSACQLSIDEQGNVSDVDFGSRPVSPITTGMGAHSTAWIVYQSLVKEAVLDKTPREGLAAVKVLFAQACTIYNKRIDINSKAGEKGAKFPTGDRDQESYQSAITRTESFRPYLLDRPEVAAESDNNSNNSKDKELETDSKKDGDKQFDIFPYSTLADFIQNYLQFVNYIPGAVYDAGDTSGHGESASIKSLLSHIKGAIKTFDEANPAEKKDKIENYFDVNSPEILSDLKGLLDIKEKDQQLKQNLIQGHFETIMQFFSYEYIEVKDAFKNILKGNFLRLMTKSDLKTPSSKKKQIEDRDSQDENDTDGDDDLSATKPKAKSKQKKSPGHHYDDLKKKKRDDDEDDSPPSRRKYNTRSRSKSVGSEAAPSKKSSSKSDKDTKKATKGNPRKRKRASSFSLGDTSPEDSLKAANFFDENPNLRKYRQVEPRTRSANSSDWDESEYNNGSDINLDDDDMNDTPMTYNYLFPSPNTNLNNQNFDSILPNFEFENPTFFMGSNFQFGMQNQTREERGIPDLPAPQTPILPSHNHQAGPLSTGGALNEQQQNNQLSNAPSNDNDSIMTGQESGLANLNIPTTEPFTADDFREINLLNHLYQNPQNDEQNGPKKGKKIQGKFGDKQLDANVQQYELIGPGTERHIRWADNTGMVYDKSSWEIIGWTDFKSFYSLQF